MKILVAGGTGFIGKALCRHALDAGHEVTILTRDLAHAHHVLPSGTACITWEQWHAAPIEQTSAFDAVVNLCGESVGAGRWTKTRKSRMRDSRLQPTRALAEACAALGEQSPTFLSASGVNIYGTQDDKPAGLPAPFDEHAAVNAGSADWLTRLAIEWEAATDMASKAGVRVLHWRMGMVLGPGGGSLTALAWPIRLGLGAVAGTGRQPVSWVSLLDVCRGIIWALAQSPLAGPVNMVSPHTITHAEMMRALGKHYHRPIWLKIPGSIMRLLYGEMADTLILRGQHVQPKRLFDGGFVFEHPHLSQALHASSVPN